MRKRIKKPLPPELENIYYEPPKVQESHPITYVKFKKLDEDPYAIKYTNKTVEEVTEQFNRFKLKRNIKSCEAPIHRENKEFKHDGVYRFKVQKYLSEEESNILSIINSHKQTFIKCPAGGGKTTFIFKNLFPVIKENGKTLIMVLPNVENLLNLIKTYSKTHKVKVLKQGETFKEGYDIYISTPDSLGKIPSNALENAYVVVDEYHACIVEKDFRRRAYANLQRAEEMAHKTIVMTATAHMFNAKDFEATIEMEVINNIKCSHLKVLLMDKITESSLPNLIKSKAVLHDMLLVINDNMEQNNMIKDELEAQGMEGIYLYSSESRDGEHMEYLREHGKLPDYVKILISTSAINSGIDINNECNFASMVIIQNEYSSAKDIQTKARNRRGSDTIYTVIRGNETSVTKESYAQPFEYYEEKMLNQVKHTAQCLNELKQMCTEKLNCPCNMIVFNDDTDKFEIDMKQVKKYALDLYDKDLTLNPYSLVKEIIENGTFTIENSDIKDCLEFTEAQEDEELKKSLKEERKDLKEFKKMQTIATKELLIKLKTIVDNTLVQLKKDYPEETEEKLMRKACRIYQALYEDNARAFLEKEANVFALEGYTNEEIEMVERLQKVGEEHLIDIKELAWGNDKVCVTYGEAAYLVAKALVEDKEYSSNRTEELKKQRKELQALLKEKQFEIEIKINNENKEYEYKKKEINNKYIGKLSESKKEKKKEELKKIRTTHKETVKKLEKELTEYKKELRIPVINENERSIGALIREIKFKALAPTLIRAAINNYGDNDVFTLKRKIKQFESNKEIRKNILKSKQIEEVALYLKHLEVRTRITKDKLNNLYLDLAEIGFIDDVDYKKQVGKHLSEYKKVDTKKIVIPPATTEELLRKINILFNISDVNRIWSLNI